MPILHPCIVLICRLKVLSKVKEKSSKITLPFVLTINKNVIFDCMQVGLLSMKRTFKGKAKPKDEFAVSSKCTVVPGHSYLL